MFSSGSSLLPSVTPGDQRESIDPVQHQTKLILLNSAWVIVAEVFPLSMRAKGISLGASSNWLK